MPWSPGTACVCGGTRRNGKCSRCGPKRTRDTREHAAARGYDYRWQKFRKAYLALNPLCSDCSAEGRVGAATDVHHVQKLCDHPELKYEDENLMPLCSMHHDRRTARGE